MTGEPKRIFREEALQRYAEGRRASEPLQDLSPPLLGLLWLGAVLLLCGLGVVAVAVALLLRGAGAG